MLKELLEQLYKTLENEPEIERKNKTGYFDFFETHILKQERFKKYDNVSVTSKTMKNYYEKHVEGRKNKAKEPNLKLKNLIAEYIGYVDFFDFCNKNKHIQPKDINKGNKPGTINKFPINESDDTLLNSKKKLFISVFIFSLSIFGLLYTKYQNKTCIVWKKDHYERTYCFAKGAIDNSKYLINLSEFKKVVLDSNTSFFTKGNPNYWYEKNGESKREFFTMRGIHPETKKELKPITRTVLDLEGLLNE